MFCSQCGSNIESSDKFCKSCGTKITTQALENKIQMPVGKKAVPVQAKELPMEWFRFYLYFYIPFNIFLGLLLTFKVSYFNVFDVIFFLFLFAGLYQRKLWGWRLNFVLLLVSLFAKTINFGIYAERNSAIFLDGAVGMVIMFVIYGLVFVLPNWIYFKKRRKLFQSSRQMVIEINGKERVIEI